MNEATVKEVMEFFDMKASAFMKEWKDLSPKDKEDLKRGIGNNSFTY